MEKNNNVIMTLGIMAIWILGGKMTIKFPRS